jgi:hypothetical protein
MYSVSWPEREKSMKIHGNDLVEEGAAAGKATAPESGAVGEGLRETYLMRILLGTAAATLGSLTVRIPP